MRFILSDKNLQLTSIKIGKLKNNLPIDLFF
ncbi:hypothetical protein EC843_108138 [Buttiauxella sp. JUb87]|nr:hypothetical protein EC843_108138 [Buttiauxella sp. JUb87]